jgi:hypothetical protein
MKTRLMYQSQIRPRVVAGGCCIFLGCPAPRPNFSPHPSCFARRRSLVTIRFAFQKNIACIYNIPFRFRGSWGIGGFEPVPVGDSLLVIFGGRAPGSGPNHGISTAACRPARCAKDVVQRLLCQCGGCVCKIFPMPASLVQASLPAQRTCSRYLKDLEKKPPLGTKRRGEYVSMK